MSKTKVRKRIKTGGGGMRRIKTSNIVVFKLVDPILQGLLFVFFVYSLDTEFRDVSYRTILFIIIALQLFSLVVNFILNPPELIKKERLIYACCIFVYLFLFFFIIKNVKEKFLEIRHGDFPALPLREVILDSAAIILSFWYNIICFREIKAMLKSYDDEEG